MARGRTLSPTQTHHTVVIMARELDVWSQIRQYAIARDIPLSEAVEDAISYFLVQAALGNVRSANS